MVQVHLRVSKAFGKAYRRPDAGDGDGEEGKEGAEKNTTEAAGEGAAGKGGDPPAKRAKRAAPLDPALQSMRWGGIDSEGASAIHVGLRQNLLDVLRSHTTLVDTTARWPVRGRGGGGEAKEGGDAE